MGQTRACVTGTLIGAGLMYAFDPVAGRRRRALFWDQLHRLARRSARAIDVAVRDLQNRARGTAAEFGVLLSSAPTSDEVLVQRVRTHAGRHLRHPGALEIDVSHGHIVLRGPVLADEAGGLVAAIRRVRGVHSVESQLDVHQAPDIPALQGKGRRRHLAGDGGAAKWSPAARLVVGGIGGILLANCLVRRSAGAMLGGLTGACLLSRAVSDAGWGGSTGLASGKAHVVQKAVEINAPIEEVFDFFADPRNLTRISDVVTSVKLHDDGHFTKELTIAGVPLRMEERIFYMAAPNKIELSSIPGSMVSYEKCFCFERLPGGCTRVILRFHYDPPGKAAAGVLGYDPRGLFADLLMRAKSYLETGGQPHDALRRDRSPGGEHAQAASSEQSRNDALRRDESWPHSTSQLPPAV